MIEDKIKEISELSFKAKNEKDESEKEKLETDVKELLMDLKKQAIESFKEDSNIKKFLDNIATFNNYSFNNQCLIWIQNPDAHYVASKTTYNKMGYDLKDGEYDKSLKILVPSFLNFVKIKLDNGKYEVKPFYMLNSEEQKKYKDKNDDSITFHKKKLTHFSIGYVYDMNQTTMPFDEIDSKLNPMLEDPKADEIADIFIKAIYRDGFKVRYDKIENGAKGYCDFDSNEIVIADGLNNLMKLKVIIHEYAHSQAHKHLKENKLDYKEHREKYETEAESIAYVVSKYLGFDTKDYSFIYLYGWSKNRDFEEIDDSFNAIVNYSKKIINNFEKMLEKNRNVVDELYPNDYEVGISI